MASSKNLALVLALGLFLILFAGVVLFGFGGFAVQAPVVENVPSEEVALQEEVKLTGLSVCLPHKNPGEIQTMECAFGLQVGNEYYSLDLGSFAADFQTGVNMTIEGTYIPLEALSSNQWQKYDIKGIVTVTSITTLNQ